MEEVSLEREFTLYRNRHIIRVTREVMKGILEKSIKPYGVDIPKFLVKESINKTVTDLVNDAIRDNTLTELYNRAWEIYRETNPC